MESKQNVKSAEPSDAASEIYARPGSHSIVPIGCQIAPKACFHNDLAQLFFIDFLCRLGTPMASAGCNRLTREC